ncbi:hypothetical protein C8J57DRAFT_1067420, partial [Mycena rebaudengoi]
LRRSTELWFSNDSLVLQAEEELFRVSASILTARSRAFRDMVSLPQSGEEDKLDGVPVVRLHDAAADLWVFLLAIFDSSFSMPSPEWIDIHVVLGIVRLAHKYDVEYLFRRGLEHLTCTFPSHLAQYHDTVLVGRGAIKYRSPHSSVVNVPALLEVIKLATEVSAAWILPVAYYNVCVYGVPSILDLGGVHWSNLHPEQQRKCLVAHIELVGGMLAAHDFFRTQPEGCLHPRPCAELLANEAVELLRRVGEGDIDVLWYWTDDG